MNAETAPAVVTYQFDCDDELWNGWKDTVPRSKSLETRINELIEADRDGRVLEEGEPPRAPTREAMDEREVSDAPEPEPESEEPAPSDSDDVIADVVAERADAWKNELPKGERKLALMQVLERVREEGTVSVAELKAMEADYPVEGQTRENWWDETVRKGLKEVAEYDNSVRGYEWVGRAE